MGEAEQFKIHTHWSLRLASKVYKTEHISRVVIGVLNAAKINKSVVRYYIKRHMRSLKCLEVHHLLFILYTLRSVYSSPVYVYQHKIFHRFLSGFPFLFTRRKEKEIFFLHTQRRRKFSFIWTETSKFKFLNCLLKTTFIIIFTTIKMVITSIERANCALCRRLPLLPYFCHSKL